MQCSPCAWNNCTANAQRSTSNAQCLIQKVDRPRTLSGAMLQDCGCAPSLTSGSPRRQLLDPPISVPRIHLLRKRSRAGVVTGHADITDFQMKSARTKSAKDTKVLGYTANNEDFVSECWIAEGSDLAG